MPTYESIRYKISGTAITGVLKVSENLNDVANKTTSRSNLDLEVGVDVQGFVNANLGTNGVGTRTVATGNPTGGSDGDIWLKYTT
tara:strand:- start:455 stop:709 length:255 start_codon:yes stop_codon:yes gene_type:complete